MEIEVSASGEEDQLKKDAQDGVLPVAARRNWVCDGDQTHLDRTCWSNCDREKWVI